MIDKDLRRCAVRVYSAAKAVDYYQPWESGRQYATTGSGCCIGDNRVVTNAHLVASGAFVQVSKPDNPRKYVARVLFVSHDLDLALLAIDDPQFREGTVAPALGDLPLQHAPVSIYGFPDGGNELSITAGIVSRRELYHYSYSRRYLLALQTDAAINPGSSGAPVFADDKLVGIAFQSHDRRNLQNTGYLIPSVLLSQFLKDVDDGHVSGVPDLGVTWQATENPTLRRYLGLDGMASGILISTVMPGSTSDSVLLPGDVLLALGSRPVLVDGSLQDDNLRVGFSHEVSRRQVGDYISVTVRRGHEVRSFELQLRPPNALVPAPRPGHRPSYFVFAGLVFTRLTAEYMNSWPWEKISHHLKYYYFNLAPTSGMQEVVLLSHVLAHDINVGYHEITNAVVSVVNGVPVRLLSDLISALNSPVGDRFHVIELAPAGVRTESMDAYSTRSSLVVLDARECEKATAEVVRQYGIGRDRSEDLEVAAQEAGEGRNNKGVR